ncbi:MAG: hypothetical protein V4795_10030 [Pseudomonadota bacterium]
MTKTGRIVGTVEFRAGDGPKMPIPLGLVEIETGHAEATLSWVDGETRGAAAMPIAEFNRYRTDGAIQLDS